MDSGIEGFGMIIKYGMICIVTFWLPLGYWWLG
jgi:hypothetical protein